MLSDKQYQFNTQSPIIGKAVLQLAEMYGWQSRSMFVNKALSAETYPWLVFYGPNIIGGNTIPRPLCITMTLDAALKIILQGPPYYQIIETRSYIMTDQVDTKCTEVCRALCELAKSYGWTGSIFVHPNHVTKYHCLVFNNNDISGNRTLQTSDHYQTITIDEAIAKIKRGPAKTTTMDFQINGFDVIVNNDVVKVGCVAVTKEQVKEMWEALNK